MFVFLEQHSVSSNSLSARFTQENGCVDETALHRRAISRGFSPTLMCHLCRLFQVDRKYRLDHQYFLYRYDLYY